MQVIFGHPGRKTKPWLDCALTIGNFDGVHLGHQQLLATLHARAKVRGLATAVLTFEPHPLEFFKREPIPARLSTLRDKIQLFADTGLVDYLYIYRFNADFSRIYAAQFMQDILIRQLSTRYLLIGDDFHFGFRRHGNIALLKSCTDFVTEVMLPICVEGIRASSSLIRQQLSLGDLARAKAMLGRPYQLSGRVVYGQQLGRTLGFPTANIHLPHLKPALQGIFAVQLCVESVWYDGVASLGINPTVSHTQHYKLEVYLFDFSGNLYGKRVSVRFLKKLRDEKKFDSLGALTQQIKADVDQAKTYLTSMQQEQQV